MIIGSQVKTCLGSLKNVQTDLEQFSLSTQNEKAKELYTNAAKQLQKIIKQIQNRIKNLEAEESKYKGF